MSEKWFTTPDGLRLRCWKWPAPDHPRARLLIIHGLGENGARYEPLARQLNQADLEVWACDQRGHGESPGKKGDLPNPSALERDMAAFIDQALDGTLPVFVWAHSAGVQITLNAIGLQYPAIHGLILTSGWFRLVFQPPIWKQIASRWLLHLAPGLTLPTGLPPRALSRDLASLQTLPGHALVHKKISARLFHYLMIGGERALRLAEHCRVPLLVLHGSDDTVTDWQASRSFYEQAATTDKTWQLIDGGLHELHHDLCREAVRETMTQWILARS